MRSFTLNDRSNDALRRDLEARFASERGETAELVAHLAEFDARGLHEAAGFDSMHAYCMKVGRLSEDAAYRRLTAARTARKFPCLFEALADGRLHLSAICILAPHLTAENVAACVAAATHRSNAEIRDWLVGQMLASAAKAAPPSPAARQLEVRLPRLAPARVTAAEPEALPLAESVPAPPAEPAPDPGPVEFELRFTISREDHERFRYAQALLSHAVPSGEVAAIFRRAIEAVITECEKRKLGAGTNRTSRKERATRGNGHSRHIPAHVRRAVWIRDGGRCTYVTPSGHRCDATKLLEFDHVTPAARGGLSTVENVRLRCRAHNQEAAKQALGARFMNQKRKKAAAARAIARALPSWKAGTPIPRPRNRRVMKA
jgi:5-methylcytosine-specific restriction endonuclease McrA